MNEEYVVEMLDIVKKFPGIIANDNITLRLKKGEVHALLGENGAGKSTLMSVLFGMYQPESGVIKKDNEIVKIENPNDANRLGIGMVHQHFKLVDNFTVLQNVILGVEDTEKGLLKISNAREKVVALSEKYGLKIDPDALISDITVGMQQRVEILKMLYRDNEVLIFDEPTAVLTPQEISELMKVMKELSNEGKSILFITHKLNEIKEIANRCTILRKGKFIGTVDVATTSKDEMSKMMVGREVDLDIKRNEYNPKDVILKVNNLDVINKKTGKKDVNNVSFEIREGEIVCIAGIDGNGQSELIFALTGLLNSNSGEIVLKNKDLTHLTIKERNMSGMGHIPEDRHKYGLVLEYNIAYNTVLKTYNSKEFQKYGFLKFDAINKHAENLVSQFDIRSSQGIATTTRSMSGGNQQKIIIAREIYNNPDLLIAVQPTRGLDVGAIEYIHKQLISQRDKGKAVLLVSMELDEVMNLSDRILVMYEGEIVADLKPKEVTVRELGLYMAGAKRGKQYE